MPSHVRSIALRPIADRTDAFGLENRLMTHLEIHIADELTRDGRYQFANDESRADGVLTAEIVRYIKEPVAWDSNHVITEYKLWVLLNVQFIDRVENAVIWEEPRMEQTLVYSVETRPGGITEEEARSALCNAFARDIVKRTVEGFGSVTGASGRKISDTPHPPAHDENSP